MAGVAGQRASPRSSRYGAGTSPFFVPAGAEAYARDVPSATVLLLDTGHFALEEEVDTIAEAIHKTLTDAFA